MYEGTASDIRVNPQEGACSRETVTRTAILRGRSQHRDIKDDQASMEHPFFSLSKSHDTAIRSYEHNGNTITIARASMHANHLGQGRPHLLLLQLIEGMKRGLAPKREVIFPPTAFSFRLTAAPAGKDTI